MLSENFKRLIAPQARILNFIWLAFLGGGYLITASATSASMILLTLNRPRPADFCAAIRP